MPVIAPADRRFLRAQVKPGRRQSAWRPWLRAVRVLLLVGILALVMGLGVAGVMHASSLRVARITVAGTHRLSNGEVLALLDGLRGQNILQVRLDAWRARVLACPWVGDALLRRALPSTIEVVISERRPIAIGRIGEDLYLVDDRGAVIDEYGPRYADLDLPIVDGLGHQGPADGDLNERRAELAARVLQAVRSRPELAGRISQLDVSDPRDAVVVMEQDTARVRLGNEQFAERLQAYLDLAPTLRDQMPSIDYVDLRFGDHVYAGPQGKPAGGESGARRK